MKKPAQKEFIRKPEEAQKGSVTLPKTTLIAMGVLVLLVVLGIGAAVYFYSQYQHSQDLLKNPTAASQTQVQDLIKRVSRLIELPTGEQPTVATVSDVSKLKDQTFFRNAKNGDKVLIYTKAKKAVLYDPTADKIIEVGPVNLGNQQATASQAPQQGTPTPTSTPVKVAIYNGTKTPGLASTTETMLKSQGQSVTVIAKGNTVNNYTTTTVVDLTGKNAAAANGIAKALNAKVGSLPTGETKPTGVDILIVVGK